MTKFYIVPAEIMESNFPDEFEDGDYPGEDLGIIEAKTESAIELAKHLSDK